MSALCGVREMRKECAGLGTRCAVRIAAAAPHSLLIARGCAQKKIRGHAARHPHRARERSEQTHRVPRTLNPALNVNYSEQG